MLRNSQGKALLDGGFPVDAVAHLQRATARNPRVLSWQRWLGQSLAKAGSLDAAKASYDEILARLPTEPDWFLERALVRERLNEPISSYAPDFCNAVRLSNAGRNAVLNYFRFRYVHSLNWREHVGSALVALERDRRVRFEVLYLASALAELGDVAGARSACRGHPAHEVLEFLALTVTGGIEAVEPPPWMRSLFHTLVESLESTFRLQLDSSKPVPVIDNRALPSVSAEEIGQSVYLGDELVTPMPLIQVCSRPAAVRARRILVSEQLLYQQTIGWKALADARSAGAELGLIPRSIYSRLVADRGFRPSLATLFAQLCSTHWDAERFDFSRLGARIPSRDAGAPVVVDGAPEPPNLNAS